MILIKDNDNNVHVFCNVEFILHDDVNRNGYCTVRDMANHELLYKYFTKDINQLTVDGISLIATFDL